jgi:hypothetical protein
VCWTGSVASSNCLLPISCVIWYTYLGDDFRRAWPDPQDRLSLRLLSINVQMFGAAGMTSYFKVNSVPTLLSWQTLYRHAGTRSSPTTVQTKALPSNQWQQEVECLSQTLLAAIQHFIVDYAGESLRRSCYSEVCLAD